MLFVTAMSLYSGCANTSASPAGGPKDSIPPVLLQTIPDIDATNIPTDLKRVELQFDEYVKLVDATKLISMSPPQEKNPEVRTKGKGIVVDFMRDLDSNTTYCVNFGSAIQDNNEGNPFPMFALSFSTGSYVDSLMFSGIVVDAATLLPVDNATVLLHLNPVDSTLEKCRPVAATRTDSYGYFTVRNLKDTLYTLYAITDENNNYKYDPTSGENVSFLDSLIRPRKVMYTYAPEIQPYYITDTIGLLRRPLETSVFTFKEHSKRQYLKTKERFQQRAVALKFGRPQAQIISAQFEGIDSTDFIRQRNFYNDSLIFWITAKNIPDTLRMHLSYMATDDSLNILVPKTDTIKLAPYVDPKAEEALKAQEKNEKDKKGAPGKKEEEMMELKVTATPEIVSYQGITIDMTTYPVEEHLDKAVFRHVTASKDTVPDTFTIARDTLNPTTLTLYMDQYLEGIAYELYLPKGTFKDIYNHQSDSLVTKFTTPTPDDLCALTLVLNNVNAPLIVDLMNESRTNVERTMFVQQDTSLQFSYLKAGKYAIRITEDVNSNRLWDTGNVSEHQQAERVRIFTMSNGNMVLELKEKMDLKQEVDVAEFMNQIIRLTAPSKSGSSSNRN